jgi:PadR family transcriptional regulator PadR
MNSNELLKGTLIPIILKLLDDHGEMYGYDITQKVKELSGGKIMIKEGSLYPALHKLLADELVSVRQVNIGNRIRKYYFLTPKGKTQKNKQFEELHEFLGIIYKIVFPQIKLQV